MAQGLRQGCVLSRLLFNVLFAAILLVALLIERFGKDAGILAELIHLQEQPSKFDPETALEVVRRANVVCSRRVHRVAVTARAGADDGGLRRSLRHTWLDHLREQNGDHMHADSMCTGYEDSLQRHGATVPPNNLLHLFLAAP